MRSSIPEPVDLEYHILLCIIISISHELQRLNLMWLEVSTRPHLTPQRRCHQLDNSQLMVFCILRFINTYWHVSGLLTNESIFNLTEVNERVVTLIHRFQDSEERMALFLQEINARVLIKLECFDKPSVSHLLGSQILLNHDACSNLCTMIASPQDKLSPMFSDHSLCESQSQLSETSH